MRRYAKTGPVLYINSIVMQKPKLSQGTKVLSKLFRKAKSIFTGLKKVDNNFLVYSPFSMPLHHIVPARQLNEKLLRCQVQAVMKKLKIINPVLWVVCSAACDTALKMKYDKLVYLRTDVYELFPNVDHDLISEYDLRLKKNADLTVFVSELLYTRESSQCRKALFVDHGVDFDFFASDLSTHSVPLDMRDIPKPIAGYFGSIDGHTVDYDLISRVADLLPKISIVFVGKVYSMDSNLYKNKNVWMLGPKPYELIPDYGKCFDVAIMPWRQTRWIEACNPIKLKEYLALGKPVVSTPFNELNKYLDVVYEARSSKDFAKAIEKALMEDNPERVASRRERVRNATWDSKAQLVLEELFDSEGHHSGKD
jgi:glycosyltransferase involved in cell wall biosynthesis